jgi:predicted nucleic acid-binding protein
LDGRGFSGVTTYVLDTNVLSELVRLRADPGVTAFLREADDVLVSAIAFHEIAYGVERLRDPKKRIELELFLEGVKAIYEGRIVDIDVVVAELAGRLRARASRSGWVLSELDGLIAATAMRSGATLVTRNIVDFERLGIPLVNPWMA